MQYISNRLNRWPVIVTLASLVCAFLLTNIVSSESSLRRKSGPLQPAVRTFDIGLGPHAFNVQLGRDTQSRYLGAPELQQAIQSAQLQPRSMVTNDFNGDAMGDLVIGYANGGTGALSMRQGNPQAISPTDPSVFRGITEGRYPAPFLPEAKLYAIPEAADFLQFGDFNSDGYADVITAARGSQRMYLLAGDGRGSLGNAQAIEMPGLLTAMQAAPQQLGTFTKLAVGLALPTGTAVGLYSDVEALSNGPESYSTPAEVRSLLFDRLDDDEIPDLAVATSNQIMVIHGRNDQPVPVSKEGSLVPSFVSQKPVVIESQRVPFTITGLSSGNFVFDRNHQQELAVLSSDGTIYLSAHGNPDKRLFTETEKKTIVDLRRSLALNKIDMETFTVEMNKLARANTTAGWNVSETITGKAPAYTGAAQPLFQKSNSSGTFDELIVGDVTNNRVNLVKNEEELTKLKTETTARASEPSELAVSSAPIAAVSTRLSVNGQPGMVILSADNPEPNVVIITPDAVYTVNSTADLPDSTPTAANGVCQASNGLCTLRAAVMQSNHTGGSNTIMVPDGTYTLTLGPPDDEANTGGALEQSGDLDIFSWADFDGSPILTAVNITGGTRDGCIIQMGTLSPTLASASPNNKERILQVNDSATGAGQDRVNVTLTNLTMQNAVEPTGSGVFLDGGAVRFDGFDFTSNTNIGLLTIHNAKLQNNTSAGFGAGVFVGFGSLVIETTSIVRANTAQHKVGGGAAWTGGNTVETQFFRLDGSTVGGALVADGNLATDATFGAGAGVDARGGLSATVQNGSVIQNNVASVNTGTVGGGGIQINSPSVVFSNSTISNNTCKSNGGGIFNSARNAVTNAPSTLTMTTMNVNGNVADSDNNGAGDGGGLYNFFGTAVIQTTSHVDGNTAVNGGGIFQGWTGIAGDSTAGLTVQTSSTIGQAGAGNGNSAKNNGGSIAIQQVGATTFGPITLNGLFFTNNTANSDNSGGGDGGAIFISAGTITSLNGCTIDSNVANSGTGDGIRQTGGTINGAGTINLNGGDSISLSGGTFTSTSGTLNLTGNLLNSGGAFAHNNGTVICNGSSAQTIGGTTPMTFNNLTINNSAGVTMGASETVAGTLTLTSGVLSIGTNTLTLNGPVSFTSGSISSAATGTVNYNQSAANQNVAPGTYGNLTFSNFVKVLPNGSTVSIAGTFTPGTTQPTNTGSTVDFNGAATQTVPPLNYNNLTISGNRGGSTVTLGAGTIGVAGIFNPSATNAVYSKTGNTFDFNGAGAQTIPAFDYNNLTVSNTHGANAVTLVNGGTIGVAGTFTPGTSTFVITGNTMNFNGAGVQTIPAFNFNNLTVSNTHGANAVTLVNGGTIGVAGVFTPGTSTFVVTGNTMNFNGAGAQTIPAFNFNNLTVSNTHGANAVTLINGGTIGVAGVFTPGTNTFVITGNTFDFNGSGVQTVPAFDFNNLTISNTHGANAVTFVNGGTIGIAGAFTPGGSTFITTGNTVNFNGAGVQTVPGFPFNNLTISNTHGANAVTLINGGTIGVAGVFTPGTSIFVITGNTMNFNGAGVQTIPAFNFNNLTVSNTHGANVVTLVNGGTTGIAGTFTPGTSTFAITGNTIDFNGSGGQTIPAFNYNNLTSSNTGARTLINGGTIGIASVFTPGTNAYTITGNTINFNGAGAQTIPGFTYNNLTSSGGGAVRTLDPVNPIKIAAAFTPGTDVYTITGSTVEYNGAAAQTLPATFTTYNNLTLNNPTTVGGFVGLTVQGLLRVQAGTFTSSSTYNNVQVDTTGTLAGTAATTINVSGNWTINTGGAFTPNGNTVNFNGSGAQTIGGTATAAGATTFNNLTIANAGLGVTLAQNETVNGVLTLTNDLNTSTFTLTMPAGGSSTGNSDVIGTVKRTNFVSGACANPPCANTLSFGNPNNQITITAGTAPTDITVKLVKSAPASFTSSVTRTYTVTPNGGTPTATLRLHYLDVELNGNIESQLDLWRFNGSVFVDQQQTARDAVNNWVEKNGVTTFSDWTIATHVNQAPSVTSATTVVGAQTTSGLVIDRQPADAGSVTHFKITSITNGTLFKNDGVTQINNNDFITYAEGNAGLKFTPTANSTATGSFNVQASSDASGTGLSPTTAATITVNQGNTTTTITSDSPDSSSVGQVVTVNFTVVPNLPSTGTPTGNVVITVNDASGDTCTGTVAAGTCNLTLTTTGSKILTATYAGDSNFITSIDTEPHDVGLGANAVDDNYSTFKNTPLNIAAPGVLTNDTGSPTVTAVVGCSDATDPFTGCATTAGGTVTVNGNGSFSYTPPSAVFTGADSFTYTATNGGGSDNAIVNITVSDTVYINEILFNPPGTDAPNEYIELRGAASSTIPSGTYLVAIEGDSADNAGDVQTIINLSGLTFGSNGFLVLLQNGNTYTTVAGANVLTSTTTGFGGLPGGIWSADAGATDIEDASVTFMVIQTGTAPALTNDIDTDDNGTPDGATFTGWSVIDSIGALDGTATTDRAYGAINYSNNTGTPGTAPGTPILVAFTASYLGRSGDTTGSAAADWVASGALGGAQPNWTLSATETEPIAFANQPLNHIGTTNFDVSPPTVQSITRVGASPTNATSVDFLVTFSEPVTGVDSADFTLTTTGVSGSSITTVTGSGATRTVTVNTGTLSGTIRLDLTDDDSIKDGSNNALGGVGAGNGSFTTGEVYTIDKSAPTVDITDVTPDPRTTSVSSISIVFSEAITGFDLADLSLTRDGGANLLTGSQTLTTSDNITWTLGNLSSLTGADGNYALTLTSGGISDNAGNALSAGASDTWVVNAAAPTVDITDVTPDPRNTSVSSIAIVFSEAVTGFDIGDLSLTRNGGGNLLTGAQTLTSGDNITWTLGNLSGLTGTDGSYTLTLTAPGGITDSGGASLASGATDSWSMDTTGPTVTINQASGQADPTSGSPINFTVVFNEAVTNFVTGDVTFSGAGATTATVTETAPNNGTTYNVAITGMNTSGTVTASLLAGVASDALGNLSQASSSSDNSVTFNFVANSAPVLDNTGNMSLTTISEDVANASNSGILVTDIIASAGGDRITDVDPGAVEGIAVNAVDNTNGTWQFSIDNGSNWSPFGSPDTLNSRLLASNATTRVRFIPNADFNGTVDPGITFRAWDQTSGTNGGTADTTSVGGGTAFSTATETASITITEVNDAPTATGEALTDVAEDSGQRSIPFGDLTANDSKGPANESGQTLIVNAVSNPVGGTVSISAGNVLFTPTLNFNGAASFQYTVQDNGTTNGGADFLTSNTATATFTVTAVNDVPVNTVPGSQSVTENSGLTFSAGNGNAISIADLDAGSNPVQVQLTATNGVITLSGTSGLSFTTGDGTADVTMTFTGTIANINTALNGMVFTPTAGFSGAASLQIISNDQGNTGSGGALSDTDTVAITVNDGGTLQFSAATSVVSEGTANATITITRSGGSAGTATVVFSTSDGTATAGQDYTAVTNQTVTFNNGDTSKTVDIPITNDSLDENNETVNLTLSSPGGSGVLGAPAAAVLTINDDDGAPALSINDVSLSEGNSGTTTFTFTVTLSPASALPVTVNYATANGTADSSDYTAVPSTLLTFNPGDLSKTVDVIVNGDILAEADETFFVNLVSPSNATIADNQGKGTIQNDDAAGGVFVLSSATYSVAENSGSATITVNRTGTLTQAVSIDYATSDGTATERKDYTSAFGTLKFAAGESSKTFTVLINQDAFAEPTETVALTLSNASGGAALGVLTTAILQIGDVPWVGPPANPIDDASFFVRQHYHDFLNREPDAAGLAFWTNEITSCGSDASCTEVKRINVSAAFFLSIEFQVTGGTAYLTNKVSFNSLPSYTNFERDTQALQKGFVFGAPGSATVLEANKVAYFDDFVARPTFVGLYGLLSNTNYVDALIANTGVSFTSAERSELINALSNATETRATILRKITEKQSFKQAEFTRSFVLMEYFGYLRRDPDMPGFNFWLAKLNQFNGNFISAEMVKAFISSIEYRQRFAN